MTTLNPRDLSSQSTYKYRVPQCMSPRRNWDSPNPLPQESVPPKPKGGGHSRLRVGGVEVPIPTTGEKA
jgi:hypothetical protein